MKFSLITFLRTCVNEQPFETLSIRIFLYINEKNGIASLLF